MTSKATPPRKLFEFAALLCLVPPLLIQGIWMNTSNEASDMALRKSDFLSYFPSFMQNGMVIHLLALAFCIAAILLGSRSFNQKLVSLRVLSMFTVLAASVLALLNIFQML